MSVRIAFRVDASSEIGSGHVMRCLALAEALRDRGALIVFLSKELPGHLNAVVREHGFSVMVVPGESVEAEVQTARALGGVDWLIIDHYGIDASLESRFRPHANRLMVIDDLANRPHECDLLLDQNLYEKMADRYRGLVPAGCRTLVGPRHVLLRREFFRERRGLKDRTGAVKRFLAFFGGADATQETEKVLAAFRASPPAGVGMDVVVGASNPRRSALERMSGDLPGVSFFVQANMAERMARTDFMLAAGGTTLWERCYLGLPSASVVVSPIQREATQMLADRGATWILGASADVSVDSYVGVFRRAMSDAEALRAMSKAAFGIVPFRDDVDAELMGLLLGGISVSST